MIRKILLIFTLLLTATICNAHSPAYNDFYVVNGKVYEDGLMLSIPGNAANDIKLWDGTEWLPSSELPYKLFNMGGSLNNLLFDTGDNLVNSTATDGNHVLPASEIDIRIASSPGGACSESDTDPSLATILALSAGECIYSKNTGDTFKRYTNG